MLFKPSFPVRSKVRIGEKRQSQRGSEYPVSVDYFVSDDEEFGRLYGDKPQTLRIRFVYADVEDNFSTGLEWWVKGKGNTLACYTKDGKKALRLDKLVGDADVIGEPIKSGRVPIRCGFRECPIFQRKDCKPMGRLIFQLDGTADATSVLELDTKSWNSIEALTAFFSACGDPRGRVFELSVAFHQKGSSRFPVLSIQEADVIVNSKADADKADALVQLHKALATGENVRHALAGALDHTNPGWRDNAAFTERIKAVGVEAAAKGLLERNGL